MVGLVFLDLQETDQFPFFVVDANRRYVLMEVAFWRRIQAWGTSDLEMIAKSFINQMYKMERLATSWMPDCKIIDCLSHPLTTPYFLRKL